MTGAAMGASVVAMRPQRLEVTGTSMVPTLLPGDRVLAIRRRRYAIGDLVVVPDPRQPARLLVKRLVALPRSTVSVEGLTVQAGEGEVVVLGDNLAASTDSRTVGPVPVGNLGGRCVYRYHPPERAGWLLRARRWPHPRRILAR